MHLYFISDLHLSNDDQDNLASFAVFINSIIENHSRLYILGDLFDVWIGDDDTSTPLIENLIPLFKKLKDKNVTTFFCHGNRDFLLGETFASLMSVNLLEEKTILYFQDKKILLMHGDQLCTDDHDYQQFRSMVRSTEWQQKFLSKPLAKRREMAVNMRIESTKNNKNKSLDIMDANKDSVSSLMQDESIDILIHGHTHRPAFHAIKSGPQGKTRVVLGDWDKNEKVLLLSDGLMKFCSIKKNALQVIREQII